MRRFAKSDKVADLLHHAISNAFIKEMENPDLRWITVTDVRLSKDLSVAKVYYTVLEPNLTREKAKRALDESMRDLRSYLGRNLHLKQTPELRFAFDETLENAEHIEDLIRSLHQEKGNDGNP